MKFRSKAATPAIDGALSRSVNFEITVADIARRSERRAWFVASTATLMSLVLAGGYFYMLPLKEKVPYLVMADAYTGTSTVARLTDDFTDRKSTRLNSSHLVTSYAVFCLKKQNPSKSNHLHCTDASLPLRD